MSTGGASPILVGWNPVDRRPEAVFWAAETAAAHDVGLVIFSSYAELRAQEGAQAFESVRHAHQENVAGFMERTRSWDLPCTFEQSANDVRVSLLTTADDHEAALVVIDNNRRSNPGLLHLGSETEFLAHNCNRPLAVIRTPSARGQRIVVADDGSAHGVAAAHWATAHAQATTSTVKPATVSAGARGLDQLISVAEEINADMFVIGAASTESSPLNRRVGGLAMRALHETARSLVIVPDIGTEGPSASESTSEN